MKKLSIILFLSIFLFSCKKEEPGPENATLIGKWNLVRNYDKNYPTQNQFSFRQGSYISFSESGIYAYFAEGSDPFESETWTYVREGKKLQMSGEYWEIAKITPTSLVLDMYEEDTTGFEYYGTLELSK